MSAQGIVFDIQRFSLHDGPGIRTTVFLKGCNMRCAWCHNPESFAPQPQISVNLARCIGCTACAKVCETGAQVFKENTHQLRMDACVACGKCVSVCPAEAITVIGKAMTVEEVMDTVLKDNVYYKRTGGGVTFSGGEPSVQFDFLYALAAQAKEYGLHVCVETNGLMESARLSLLEEKTDIFLLDYKHSAPEAHRQYTGVSQEGVLKTLSQLNKAHKTVWLRCPIIPGINDSQSHFKAIRSIRAQYACIAAVELMPYHTIGTDKWENIGLPYTLSDIPPPTQEQVLSWNKSIQ